MEFEFLKIRVFEINDQLLYSNEDVVEYKLVDKVIQTVNYPIEFLNSIH